MRKPLCESGIGVYRQQPQQPPEQKRRLGSKGHGVRQASGDIIVTLDADGETDPDEIPRFLDPLLHGYDFAKGSRSACGFADKPLHRRLGNRAIATSCIPR